MNDDQKEPARPDLNDEQVRHLVLALNEMRDKFVELSLALHDHIFEIESGRNPTAEGPAPSGDTAAR